MENKEADVFAEILKKHSTKKPLVPYDKNKKPSHNKTEKYNLHEVILGVAKQMKCIQSADSDKKDGKQRNDLSVYKNSEFIPINLLPLEQPSEHVTNNFETQYEMDTQLFNVMLKAEALIDEQKDVNQEFDTTFNHLEVDAKCGKNSDDLNGNKHVIAQEEEHIADIESTNKKDCANNQSTSETVNVNNINKSKDMKIINNNIENLAGPSEINTVSNNTDTKVTMNVNSLSDLNPIAQPLVYELELFEKFETIATPVVNNNLDFESARKIINSQIINRELFIQSHADPVMCDRDKSLSPILGTTKKPKISLKKEVSEAISVSFEDEILFSSDEENDYKNNIDELPLTCALTSSLYNQQDLNKTMYVGFQTASDKSIQVQTDSYCKAKNILDNVKIFEDVSLTKLVEAIDSSSRNNFNEDIIELNDIGIFNTENKGANNSPCNTEIVGFKTALGKDINISKEGLIKSKRVFDDILESDKDRDTNVESFNKKIKLSPNTKPNYKIEAKSDIMIKVKSKSENNNSDTTQCVNINKKNTNKRQHSNALKHAELVSIDENIMKEFENNFSVDNIYNDILTGGNNNNVLSKTEKNSANNYRNNVEGDVHTFRGFKTASNNQIKISEQGLAKRKNVFEDFNFNDLVDDQNENKENYNNFYNQPSTSKNLIGFRTANNNVINVSKQALAKTKHIFDNIDQETVIPIKEPTEKLPLNINKKDIESVVNKSTISKAKNKRHGFINPFSANKKDDTLLKLRIESNLSYKLSAESSKLNSNFERKPAFIGFQTASKKPVAISKEALAKSERMFKEILCDQSENELLKDNDNENDKNICNENNITETLDNKQVANSFNNIGFKTASNKPVKISDDAMKKSKMIFEDIPYKYNKEETWNTSINYKKSESHLMPNNLQGFITASNKPVYISAEALAKTKNIFKDLEENMSKTDESHVNEEIDINLKGFTTASNKPVKISAEALAKSKKLFQDFQSDEKEITNFDPKNGKPEYVFKGFKTASNKDVKVSADALSKSKKIFQDIHTGENEMTNYEPENTNTESVFKGFKTANNKDVKVSAEALSKSKKIFQDIHTGENEMKNCKPKDTISESVFKGFKTASNKEVKISNEALAKSRKVLQDVIDEKTVSTENESTFFGFQTANNKIVRISEEALAKSKQIFEDIDSKIDKVFNVNKAADNQSTVIKDFGFKTANNNNVSVSEESIKKARYFLETKENCLMNTDDVVHEYPLDIEDLINTEVMKNLEESLCTEDFRNDKTPVSKRSGSPILSCPRAKKRKFKTPKSTSKTNNPDTIETFKPIHNTIFCNDYKRNKNYNLKDVKDLEENFVGNDDTSIINSKFDDLLHVKFDGKRNDIDSDIDVWTTDTLKKYFTDNVNKKIIPEGWINNHIKLIIWKLLSYEIFFPNCMKNICTVKNILFQLKYRYDRELYNVERPALRKVLEKDEVPSKLMVLCVVGLYVDGVSVSVTNTSQNIELLLTDGWYCVKACADRMIDKLISDGKICVGTKLAIHGAELLNCEQGIAPWEDTSSVRLKIFGNSTRRAKWYTRLGFHGNGAILSPLSAIRAEGGKVSRLRVLVTRVYPTLYVEKFEDGSTVTRSERLEHQYQMKYESERQNQMEKLYDELEKMSDQESQDSEGIDADKGNLESGSQIYRFMKRNTYSTDFKVNLTESQTNLLHQHATKKREKLIESLQQKVQDLVKKRGLDAVRNVVPLMKMRVADVDKNNIYKAMLTIWRPNEYLLDLITEGAWLDIYNVVPTAYRLSEIQLSAGRQSIFQKSKFNDVTVNAHTDTLKRKCYHIKELQTTTSTDYNEMDTIGFIFLIETTNQFQNVFLADENKNMISVNFWGSIKKFGFENIIDTGQIVACVNLQSRSGNTKKIIPQYRATEFTYFTKTCKIDVMRKLTDEFTKKFSSINKIKFIEDCVTIKNNFTIIRHGNTETPNRLNNNDYKNRMQIESPLNLTGIDFDSFTEDLLSPKTMLRKKKVKEKLDKLQQYGEPPPLNLIHLNNSKTIPSYKSPLLKESDISNNVASIKNTKTTDVASTKNVTENIISSPVLNTTYIKSINPVRLNFCDNSEDKIKTDPFAEEFEYSPPLSF